MRPKCLFIALVFGWVVAIFLPSFLIAVAGLSPLAEGRSLPAASFAIAAAYVLLAVAAMLITLALIPADYSRGFGIGLSGARFTLGPLFIYLVGAAAAGLTAALAEAKCAARHHPEP